MIQHFRGQMGNHEVLARVLDTADSSPDPVVSGGSCPVHLDIDGDFSDCELSSTHGRGIMNLDAATRPIGPLQTSARGGPRSGPAYTALVLPQSLGCLARRLEGSEAAFFDHDHDPKARRSRA